MDSYYNCDNYFMRKCDTINYICDSYIAKCDDYYKLRKYDILDSNFCFIYFKLNIILIAIFNNEISILKILKIEQFLKDSSCISIYAVI